MPDTLEHSLILHRVKGHELKPLTLYSILALRFEVFGTELNMAYQDLDFLDLSEATQHFWLADKRGSIVSYLRAVVDKPGNPYRIAKVVTSKAHRGRCY